MALRDQLNNIAAADVLPALERLKRRIIEDRNLAVRGMTPKAIAEYDQTIFHPVLNKVLAELSAARESAAKNEALDAQINSTDL